MTRRYSGNMRGEQFLGNTYTNEVHNLDQEDTSGNGGSVEGIIKAGHDKPFNYLAEALSAGFDICAKCLGVQSENNQSTSRD